MASPLAATPPELHRGCQRPAIIVSLARPTSPPGSFVLKSLGRFLCCSSLSERSFDLNLRKDLGSFKDVDVALSSA